MELEVDPAAVAAAERERALVDRAQLLPLAVQVLAPRVERATAAKMDSVRVSTDALGALLSAATALAVLAAPLYVDQGTTGPSQPTDRQPEKQAAPRASVTASREAIGSTPAVIAAAPLAEKAVSRAHSSLDANTPVVAASPLAQTPSAPRAASLRLVP